MGRMTESSFVRLMVTFGKPLGNLGWGLVARGANHVVRGLENFQSSSLEEERG